MMIQRANHWPQSLVSAVILSLISILLPRQSFATATILPYFPNLVGTQAAVATYITTTFDQSYYLASPDLAGITLGGTSKSFDYPARSGVLVSSVQTPGGQRIGFGFTPNSRGAWNSSANGWLYPTPIPGVDLLLKILVNGTPVSQNVPGRPLTELILPNPNPSVTGPSYRNIPPVTVDYSLRANSNYGVSNFNPSTSMLYETYGAVDGLNNAAFGGVGFGLGNMRLYIETGAGTNTWTADGPAAPELNIGTVGDFNIFFAPRTCTIIGTKKGVGAGAVYSANKSLVLSLPLVGISDFAGVGSFTFGKGVDYADAMGTFKVSCLKYSFDNVALSVQSSGVQAIPAAGVVLSDVDTVGKSSNIGIQLLFKAGIADDGVAPTSLEPVALGTTLLGRQLAGLNLDAANNPAGGVLKIGSYIKSGAINTPGMPGVTGQYGFSTGLFFGARYYQVGAGVPGAGVVRSAFTITLDYQ